MFVLKKFYEQIILYFFPGALQHAGSRIQQQGLHDLQETMNQANALADQVKSAKEDTENPLKFVIAVSAEKQLANILADPHTQFQTAISTARQNGLVFTSPSDEPVPPPVQPPRITSQAKPTEDKPEDSPPPKPKRGRGRPPKNPPQNG